MLNRFFVLSEYFTENWDVTHSVTPRVLCKVDIVHDVGFLLGITLKYFIVEREEPG
jgi:hypothetical protein